MRIRQQFISNSSSTSYVIIGKCIKGSWEEAEQYTKIYKDCNCIYLEEYKYFVGRIIHSMSDGDFDYTFLSAAELVDSFNEVSRQLNIPVKDLELFCGTVAS